MFKKREFLFMVVEVYDVYIEYGRLFTPRQMFNISQNTEKT